VIVTVPPALAGSSAIGTCMLSIDLPPSKVRSGFAVAARRNDS
jgi:hypothetical protein